MDVFLPVFLVLAAVGAILGTVSFWWLLFQRRQRPESMPNVPAAVQSELVALQEQLARVTQALTAVQDTALFTVVTELYSTPGSPTQTNALLVVMDRQRQNGVLVHTFGNPQMRVMAVKDGRAHPPGGTIRAVEEAFLAKVQGATSAEEARR